MTTSLTDVVEPAQDLLFVCSSGGHLSQLMAARPWWERHTRRWVTFNLTDARTQLHDEHVIWAYHPTTRNIPNLVRNLGLAVRVLRTRRPDAIVSTGAAVAFPFFVLGRILGIPTIYIEVVDRIDTPTLTGRLCRPFSTTFCVQLPVQLEVYPGATVIGPLI
ncbi:polysaccharide biosynthesis protein [Arsenicicoccus bolidensis]|uniref:polysaccharide biosynthesis protein n=1 Tax=Arsenicicoccus bolidensis TaxID=229480 RepID=UPI0004261C9B|nr:polysaccharide biosynthesis protein [Arsenicicoccus bolidensis]